MVYILIANIPSLEKTTRFLLSIAPVPVESAQPQTRDNSADVQGLWIDYWIPHWVKFQNHICNSQKILQCLYFQLPHCLTKLNESWYKSKSSVDWIIKINNCLTNKKHVTLCHEESTLDNEFYIISIGLPLLVFTNLKIAASLVCHSAMRYWLRQTKIVQCFFRGTRIYNSKTTNRTAHYIPCNLFFRLLLLLCYTNYFFWALCLLYFYTLQTFYTRPSQGSKHVIYRDLCVDACFLIKH